MRCLILFLHVYHCVDSRPITGTMAAHRSTLRKSPESDENVSVNRRRSCNSMKISIKCKDVGPDDRPTSPISFILFRSSIVRRQGVASHSFKWRTKVAVCYWASTCRCTSVDKLSSEIHLFFNIHQRPVSFLGATCHPIRALSSANQTALMHCTDLNNQLQFGILVDSIPPIPSFSMEFSLNSS